MKFERGRVFYGKNGEWVHLGWTADIPDPFARTDVVSNPPLPRRQRKVPKQTAKKRANTGVVNWLARIGKMTGIKRK